MEKTFNIIRCIRNLPNFLNFYDFFYIHYIDTVQLFSELKGNELKLCVSNRHIYPPLNLIPPNVYLQNTIIVNFFQEADYYVSKCVSNVQDNRIRSFFNNPAK